MASGLPIDSTVPELAQLRDIHLPDAVGFWPLAPGWYGLALIGLVVGLSGILLWRRHRINGQPKRLALAELLTYQQHYQENKNSSYTCAQVSKLLKRVALVYFSRNDVASLQGESWIAFLNNTMKNMAFTISLRSAACPRSLKSASVLDPANKSRDVGGGAVKNMDFNWVRQELIELPYQPHTLSRAQREISGIRHGGIIGEIPRCARDDVHARENLDLLFELSRRWIKQRGKPCLS